jgi:hypothetical protein
MALKQFLMIGVVAAVLDGTCLARKNSNLCLRLLAAILLREKSSSLLMTGCSCYFV